MTTISWQRLAAALFLWLATSAWAADNGAVGAVATVLGKGHCNFSTHALTLDFGTIDPGSTADATATASLTFNCGGNGNTAITYSVKADDGRTPAGTGAPQMKHATLPAETLPYTLKLDPVSGTVPKNTDLTLTITGTIKPFQFQGAQAGAYQDTVVLTVTP